MGFLTGTPTRTEEVRGIEALAAAEIVGELKNLGTAITGLRTAVQNNVLATELAVIPAGGSFHRTYPNNYRAVALSNHGTADPMTVTSAPPAAGPPSSGVGVHRINAGRSAVVNMQGATLTIYGTVGDAVSFQLFDKTQPPSYS
jgi:hypothetical protein